MKNVLVVGGSMFTGRVFSIKASRDGRFMLHVVNRGNYPMDLERVIQYKSDRHDMGKISSITQNIVYDAIVDFCAYEPGDIEPLIETLSGRVKQYIFFSTASVCVPGGGFLDESAPLINTLGNANDPTDAYIRNKILLEHELFRASEKAGICCTILRPTFIYGPFNYAPRESFFIELIAKKRAVPFPADASSRFNFVYVLDIAAALMECIGDEKSYGGIFNLAGTEAVTYPILMRELEHCNGSAFETREVTVEQAEKENIPLPFPLTGDTLVDGSKFSRAFGLSYTPFSEGMKKTFEVFYSIYAT